MKRPAKNPMPLLRLGLADRLTPCNVTFPHRLLPFPLMLATSDSPHGQHASQSISMTPRCRSLSPYTSMATSRCRAEGVLECSSIVGGAPLSKDKTRTQMTYHLVTRWLQYLRTQEPDNTPLSSFNPLGGRLRANVEAEWKRPRLLNMLRDRQNEE